jgi:Na+(H+)/acetate symporter ActP
MTYVSAKARSAMEREANHKQEVKMAKVARLVVEILAQKVTARYLPK